MGKEIIEKFEELWDIAKAYQSYIGTNNLKAQEARLKRREEIKKEIIFQTQSDLLKEVNRLCKTEVDNSMYRGEIINVRQLEAVQVIARKYDILL